MKRMQGDSEYLSGMMYIQDALLVTPRLVNDIAVLDLHKITNERGKYVPVL